MEKWKQRDGREQQGQLDVQHGLRISNGDAMSEVLIVQGVARHCG